MPRGGARENAGGARPGAGRPRKDPTQVLAVRLPVPVYEAICAQAEAEGKKPGTLAAEWLAACVAGKFQA